MLGTKSARKNPVVLVVNDDLAVRCLAVEALGQASFAVQEAGDGAKGLAVFESLPFDLVLLDAMISGMDGF